MRVLQLLSLVFFISFTTITTAYAESFQCVGMDGEGNKINVLYDEDTMTINVNGQILKVTNGTQGKNGVATEDFTDDNGKKVYVSLVTEGKGKFILRKIATKDDEELVRVPLACK